MYRKMSHPKNKSADDTLRLVEPRLKSLLK
jgi:hypothetical protein